MSNALRVQIRVLHALIFRELRTRFGREQLGYIWAFLEPMIFVMVFVLLFSVMGRSSPAGMPSVLFMMTGVVPFLMFRQTLTRAMGAILANRPLLTFPQVTPLDLVIGRALLDAITMTIVFVVLLAGSTYVGIEVRIENLLLVALYWLCFSLMGFGFGAFLGAFSVMFPTIQRIVPGFLIRPLFFTSGLFFVAEMLPETARSYALLNPLLHGTELLRSAFFVEFESEYGDYRYLFAWVLLDLFLGLTAQRAMRMRILTAAQT